MTTVGPEVQPGASSAGDPSERRLPLRWLVISVVAGLAAVVSYPVAGTVAAITVATAVATALHKMID